jgi:hypothetical protein
LTLGVKQIYWWAPVERVETEFEAFTPELRAEPLESASPGAAIVALLRRDRFATTAVSLR